MAFWPRIRCPHGTPSRSGCITRPPNSIQTAPTANKRLATHGGRRTMRSCLSVSESPEVSGSPEMDHEVGQLKPDHDLRPEAPFRTAAGEGTGDLDPWKRGNGEGT